MNDYVAEILSGGSCSCVPIKLLPCQLGFPPSFGLGRITTLEQSTTLKTIIDRWKQYSGVKFLRVALPDGESNLNREIKTIGICVGSGGSLFRDIPKNSLPDLLFTGEMGHHELRSFSFNYNVPVVLTEHSNCERGFLQDRLVPMLLKQLSSGSGKCENYHFIVSEKDRDPIQIV